MVGGHLSRGVGGGGTHWHGKKGAGAKKGLTKTYGKFTHGEGERQTVKKEGSKEQKSGNMHGKRKCTFSLDFASPRVLRPTPYTP